MPAAASDTKSVVCSVALALLFGCCLDWCLSQPTRSILSGTGPEDISRLWLGKLSDFTISYLRLLRDVFDVTFKLATDSSTLTPTVLVSCRGIGAQFIF